MNAISRLRDVPRRHPHASDLIVAAVVFAATMLTTVGGPTSGGERSALADVLTAASTCGVLAVRRRWPVPALLVSAVGAEAYLHPFRGQTGVLILIAPLIALHTVADLTERRRGLTIGGLAVAAIAATHTALHRSWMGPEMLSLAALGALAVAAGDSSRNRRAYLAEVEQRAARAEHDREQDAHQRVTEERLRIARDLHDSVGHHLALIRVQALVADQLLGTAPEQAHQALSHVKTASRSAIGELRDTIGLLREPGEPAAPEQPTAGLDGLADLVASFRAAGLTIQQDVLGTVRPLARAADLTAYRVIQEALTNIWKHAGRPGARLRLAYEPAALRITVDDDGTGQPGRPAGAPTGRGGHGIIGMRERVTAIGGQFHAGPLSAGGFQVSATLPFAAPPTAAQIAAPATTQGTRS
jgi:signal transduction histidine kinase